MIKYVFNTIPKMMYKEILRKKQNKKYLVEGVLMITKQNERATAYNKRNNSNLYSKTVRKKNEISSGFFNRKRNALEKALEKCFTPNNAT